MSIGRASRAACVAVALLCLAGCAGGFLNPTVDAPRPAPAPVHPAWPGCLAVGAFDDPSGDLEAPAVTGSVPDGFLPGSAVVCAVDWVSVGADSSYQLGLERRATDLDVLITYLDRPSRRSTRPDALVCALVGYEPVWLVLVDADDRWIAPQIPLDPCGFPLDWFSETAQLPWTSPVFSDHVVCTNEQRSSVPCR